jgi:N-sulfoglucosamine sulfohydrolase
MNRPNIVYLHAHDAGRYVQPYGYSMETPNLMKFAKQGVLFRKSYCSAPTCSPSRAALLTGTTPHECGMWGLTTQGWQLNNYDRHLAQILSSAGYETALAGCQHEAFADNLEALGYRHLLDTRMTGQFNPESILNAERFLSKKREQPFFLSVGIDEPHRNNRPREEVGVGADGNRFSKTRY